MQCSLECEQLCRCLLIFIKESMMKFFDMDISRDDLNPPRSSFLLINTCIFVLLGMLKVRFEWGDYITRQGSYGDTFFILSKGKVSSQPKISFVIDNSR